MSQVRLETEPLTPKLIEKARKELRETPEEKKKALETLRQLLKNEPDIYFSDREDILIKYLRPTKFYPDSALALMKRIAEFKEKHKNLLEGLMPADLERVMMEHDGVNVLINRDQDGRRIFVTNVGKKWDPSKVSNDQVFQLFYLIHLAAMMEPATQVNGVVVILDFDGLGLKQVAALTPTFSLRLLSFIQDAMPLRLKQVHIVKQPLLFNAVWKIFKPIIREKLNNRLYFHGNDMSSLHKYINPNCLPEEYEGSLPPTNYSSKDWYPILKSLDSVIEEQNTFGLVKK
ncbi:conserved hypothetical protein [Pediculus humanus corporis]|uniref:CRAL-TRIO domain-containing protein n=1 Tax=Pediculus humanus subsp. corporis TaxID=121224 RepID=E0VDE3_PEDHC|nr:uncharacterized protein Phum_PHUM112960 [Pediculus humanus corporis]EEB11399.1 conserved hypothetical protein [Pediculus humanus corporis]